MVFRELSFSRLECGVHDRLHTYPLCGIFYFPWHRHQIEGTNGFYCLIRKTERFTISNVESQVFTPRIILAQPGKRTRAAGVRPTTGRLTAPLLNLWSRCWSMVVTLACLVKCMMCLAERRCTISSLWMLAAVCGSRKMAIMAYLMSKMLAYPYY